MISSGNLRKLGSGYERLISSENLEGTVLVIMADQFEVKAENKNECKFFLQVSERFYHDDDVNFNIFSTTLHLIFLSWRT